jgi:hypothetical protein
MTSPATAGPPAAAAADSIKASEWIAGPAACNVAASRTGPGASSAQGISGCDAMASPSCAQCPVQAW